MVYQPQSDVQVVIIPVGNALLATPTETEVTLLVCPEGSDTQLELLSIGFRAHVLPADGGAVTVDIESVDDSDSDALADLVSTYDLTSGDALVNNEVFRGHHILDPGDAINAEFATDGGLSTPATGPAFVVEYRVKRHSG